MVFWEFKNCSKCGKPRLKGQRCKPCQLKWWHEFYHNGPGKEAYAARYQKRKAEGTLWDKTERAKELRRKWEKKRKKPIVKRSRILQRRELSKDQMVNEFRKSVKRYLACWTKRGTEGFYLYKDKLPDLQDLRNDGNELLKMRLTRHGYKKDI